ncbi:MAG TPA: SIR2 family protein [Blastocatellia bacterium]|nr:SIR2 family protein [Blastocatellia bacterium]
MESGRNEEQPPYGVIAKALRRGQVVPFLGAGVNLGMPPQPDASGKVLSTLDLGTPQPSSFSRLPSGLDLSLLLAKLAEFPSEEDQEVRDLSKVASYFVETSGRRNLLLELHEVFNQEYKPCKIHEYLAGIDRPLLIVTTNYDDLTEKAFNAKGREFDLVVHPTDRKDLKASVLWWKYGETEPIAEHPNSLPMAERLKTTTVIYKMHGTVIRPWHRRGGLIEDEDQPYRDDSYVITEEDYITFLHRMTERVAVPMQFMTYFSSRQFLFLGYGLRDWNLRVVLKNLNSILNSTGPGESNDPNWAIQHGPSILEKRLWERRGVRIYNQDIDKFVECLQRS